MVHIHCLTESKLIFMLRGVQLLSVSTFKDSSWKKKYNNRPKNPQSYVSRIKDTMKIFATTSQVQSIVYIIKGLENPDKKLGWKGEKTEHFSGAKGI